MILFLHYFNKLLDCSRLRARIKAKYFEEVMGARKNGAPEGDTLIQHKTKNLVKLMHQTILRPAQTPPPTHPRQLRGWGMGKFLRCPESGICQLRGHPRALDTNVVSYNYKEIKQIGQSVNSLRSWRYSLDYITTAPPPNLTRLLHNTASYAG